MNKKFNLKRYVDTTGGPLEQISMKDIWYEFQQRNTDRVILIAERDNVSGEYKGIVYIPRRYFKHED
jgi:hypothetical protein